MIPSDAQLQIVLPTEIRLRAQRNWPAAQDRDLDRLADYAVWARITPNPETWGLITRIRRLGWSVNSTDLTMCTGSYAARLPGEQHCRECGQRVVRSDWTPAETPGGHVFPHPRPAS